MKNKQTLQQFRERVFKQSVLRSGLFGLLIGLTVAFVTALVSWFFGYDGGLWLSIGLLVGVSAISGVALYFLKYRATDVFVARRVDMLGLKERIVTMMELEGEESFMAQRQREDAEEQLKTVSPKQLKFRMTRKAIATIAAAAVIAPAMMVVCELAAQGILNSGMEIINPNANAVPEILVIYEVDDDKGGYIDGAEDQVILLGEKTEPVYAVANDGWVFVGWSDGLTDPYREGDVVEEDTIFIAFFEEIEGDDNGNGNGNGSGNGEGQGQGNGDGNGAGDMPGSGKGNGNGSGKGEGVGEGKGEGESEGDGKGEGAGGKYKESNRVYDGNTAYGDVFDESRSEAMEDLDTSTTEGDVIDGYFEGLV